MLRELAGLAARAPRRRRGRRLLELAAERSPPPTTRPRPRRLRLLHRGGPGRRQHRLRPHPQRIRGVYFAHVERVPVTADPSALAPLYARLAAAIGDGDADEAARRRLRAGQRSAGVGARGAATSARRRRHLPLSSHRRRPCRRSRDRRAPASRRLDRARAQPAGPRALYALELAPLAAGAGRACAGSTARGGRLRSSATAGSAVKPSARSRSSPTTATCGSCASSATTPTRSPCRCAEARW